MRYQVNLIVDNGGVTPVFQTNSVQHAGGFCKSSNEFNKRIGSPNRYYYELV